MFALEFIIDNQDSIRELWAVWCQIGSKVHIVTGAVSAAQNIVKCMNVVDWRRVILYLNNLFQVNNFNRG